MRTGRTGGSILMIYTCCDVTGCVFLEFRWYASSFGG